MKTVIKATPIDLEKIDTLQKEYLEDRTNTVLRHALSKSVLEDLVFKTESNNAINKVFSIDLKTMPVTDQKESGRCWIFSALNLVREIIGNKLNIANFELSQNFVGFYDKLEKFNFLLTELIQNIDCPPDERLNMCLLTTGVADGGQWEMFANIVRKYGLCPKAVFEETNQSSNTLISNKLLNTAARQFAAMAHKLHLAEKDDDIPSLKDEFLKKAYNLLSSCYGVPPATFGFEYKDKDGVYHIEKNITPLEFTRKYLGESLDEYVSLISAPTSDKEYFKTYTISHLGNVVGGKQIKHLNIPMRRIKDLVISSLSDGEPVWFGSDVGNYKNLSLGIWDDNSFDYKTPFGIDFISNRIDMLDFHESTMTHAMLITGVTLDENMLPVKWKIENSWGATHGEQGYFAMSDSWFSFYVYQVVVNKKYLCEEENKALSEKPISLPLWDPFGTLAE